MKVLTLLFFCVFIAAVSGQCTTIDNCNTCISNPSNICDDCADGYGGSGSTICIACADVNCKLCENEPTTICD